MPAPFFIKQFKAENCDRQIKQVDQDHLAIVTFGHDFLHSTESSTSHALAKSFICPPLIRAKKW